MEQGSIDFSQVSESMVESRRTVEHEESGEEISFLNNDINHNSLIIYYINHAFFENRFEKYPRISLFRVANINARPTLYCFKTDLPWGN